jgi:tRNA-splicing endonuclease subunit Sen34
MRTGIAYLVDDRLAHAHATPDEASAYAEARKKAIKKMQEEALQAEEEKNRLMKEKYKDQIEKRQREKAAKKEKQRLEGLEGASVEGEANVHVSLPTDDAATTSEAVKDEARTKAKDPSEIPFPIVTPTTSDGRAWYNPDPLSEELTPQFPDSTLLPQHHDTRSTFFLLDTHNHHSLPTVSPLKAALSHITKRGQSLMSGSAWNDGSGVTALPGGDEEMSKLKDARIRVFKDLWKKGYFMGSGLKFGADFLVYPGERTQL